MEKTYSDEERRVIASMNEVYFGRRGRPAWNDRRLAPFAADYALMLLDGKYVDSETGVETSIGESTALEVIIEHSLRAVSDFTQEGFGFLTSGPSSVPQDTKVKMNQKLIDLVERAHFTEQRYTRVYDIMTVGKPTWFLPSAKRTFLDTFSDQRPFDEGLANGALKQELLAYMRRKFST